MKIGSVDVRISILPVAVFAIFAFGFLFAAIFGPPSVAADVRSNLIWIIPVLLMFLVIPLALNYMSQTQYASLIPVYEAQAKPVRIRMINENMMGKIVRVEGVVEKVRFRFLNRPQFIIADRTGEISAKMFTNPPDEIDKNNVVEVLGMVIRRYIVTGDPVINCVSIRKIDKKPMTGKKNSE